MHLPIRSVVAVAAAIALAGCSSLPSSRGYAETGALIQSRRGLEPALPPATSVSPRPAPELPTEPLSAEQSIGLALLNNPAIHEAYARLGIGRAELEEARRIANPGFGYSRLTPQSGGGRQITRSLSMSFADLLLLPARRRFASGELERLQKEVAAQILELAAEVEVAWYAAVSAEQIAAMRDVVARSAEQSAELAQRFFDAGNINRLQLEQEHAAAAQARIAAVRAAADQLRARSELAGWIGLPMEAAWTTLARMPAPPDGQFDADALVPLALEQRLDLAAAAQEVALREDALGVSRRWRWLGAVELGYERESETDGNVLRGPSLSFELPLFNQGQGAIARAQAELLDARAHLDGLLLAVHNETRLGAQRLTVARDIAERYRSLLLPRREAIVARSQEQVNFMLMGVFELILARQEEYDAYQEYLESVRDYWTARAELRRIVGGRLPDDEAALPPVIGVESILPAKVAPAMDHSMHGNKPSAGATAESDPHAGHSMAKPESPAEVADPHAGHRMSNPAAESAVPKDAATDEPPARDHQKHDAQTKDQQAHDHGDTP